MAVEPHRIIPRAVRDDVFVAEFGAYRGHRVLHLKFARAWFRDIAFPVLSRRTLSPRFPLLRTCKLQLGDRGGEGRRGRINRKIRTIDVPDLIGARMHVHELHCHVGDVEELVAAGGDFSESGTHRDEQIGGSKPFGNLGVESDTGLSTIVRVPVVDVVLAAERGQDGDIVCFGEALDVGGGLCIPPAAADDHHGALGCFEHRLERRDFVASCFRFRRARRERIRHIRGSREHILR